MKRIALIDVDGHNFPNLPLMKLSAWHKRRGDHVEWYRPLLSQGMNTVYMSKVFTFTSDYMEIINADYTLKRGTGYGDYVHNLPPEIEHIMPDYSIYGIQNKAYGFLTRGCPRKCPFCIVGTKEGTKSVKVADLKEFWNGQKEIIIMDPNLLACPERENLLVQLAKSGAKVDINQGFDARLLDDDIIRLISTIKLSRIHFAWDNPKDEAQIVPKIRRFAEISSLPRNKIGVYVLTNFNTSFAEDVYRVEVLREFADPYIMIYDKTKAERKYKDLQRYVNNKFIFRSCENFRKYKRGSQWQDQLN